MSTAAMRLELTPTADYPSFAAVLGLRSTLKALAVNPERLVRGRPSRRQTQHATKDARHGRRRRRQSAVECDREGTKIACTVVLGGLNGKPIGKLTATVPAPEKAPEHPEAAQCGNQYTEEFAAFGLTANGMSCAEADEAVKTVKIEVVGGTTQYKFPPGYECSSHPAPRGVEETTCTSGERSFNWFLREP